MAKLTSWKDFCEKHPFAEINFDTRNNVSDIWSYMQKNTWPKGNPDLIVFYLRDRCNEYIKQRSRNID